MFKMIQKLYQNLVNKIAKTWLGDLKYKISFKLFPASEWATPIGKVLAMKGVPLHEEYDPRFLGELLAGKCFYKSDPLMGLVDYTKPAVQTFLNNGDCDDFAHLHAKVWEAALSPDRWEVGIVSYLANPWWYSHHFAFARDKVNGQTWVAQPQPTPQQYLDGYRNVVYGPFESVEAALLAVSGSYAKTKRPVFYDIRTPDWNPVKTIWL